jgi:Ni,Fe-hydrogenase maturation factor
MVGIAHVLFQLPEYDAAAKRFFKSAADAIAIANSPMLQQMPRVPVEDVRTSRINIAPGKVLELEPTGVESEGTFTISRVVDGDFSEIVEAIDRMGREEAQALVGFMVENLRKVTDATGNVVDAGGRPLSHQVILEMFEKIELTFDDEGRPQQSLWVHPDTAKRLAELPPMTPEQQRAWDELMERKREEWRARKRHRRLP